MKAKAKELKDYLKRTDISIEGNIATWNLVAQGDINGTYVGTFKFKCFLTPTEKLAAGREYRSLLGPNATLAFKAEDDLSFSLAQLRYRIVSSPPFWNSAIGIDGMAGDIPDENIINAVLDAAVASEFKYRAELEQKKKIIVARTKKAAERLLDNKDKEAAEAEENE